MEQVGRFAHIQVGYGSSVKMGSIVYAQCGKHKEGENNGCGGMGELE